MFEKVTPESVGIKSQNILNFLNMLDTNVNHSRHSILLMRGDKVFFECYWKPFDKDFLHRMYSQTKSYVGVAIGMLQEEGKLNIKDKIADYFRDKIDKPLHKYLENQTIEEMLTMTTAVHSDNWFLETNCDRVHHYFNKCELTRPSGTTWEYDSNGSQVLTSLVERLAKMPFLDYLKLKLFNEMGTFKNAKILKTPNGDSWGDSALLCTTRDMASFARLCLNYGKWNGKQLVNEEYMRKATSPVVSNRCTAHTSAHTVGYGYQIWQLRNNSFAFLGMGGQLTVCNPEKDIIFVCTSDTQGASYGYDTIFNYLFDEIILKAEDKPLTEDIIAQEKINEYINTRELRYMTGNNTSKVLNDVNGKTYNAVWDNPMGIKEVTLTFKGDEGVFKYVNAQGEKEITFGINKNLFGKFPQLGYSDEVGTVPAGGDFMYNSASSGAWLDDNRFILLVQIIDKYFGNMSAVFAFKNDCLTIDFTKTAEAFLNEYQGRFVGELKK